MMGYLRNVIIHERFGTIKNLSVPIPSVVEKIKFINNQLINPERVFPKFKRDVKTFKTNDVLTIILGSVRKDQYSQFPIYNGKDFIGLLTENGITRWLASHSEEADPLIALREVKADEILSLEENPKNCFFHFT
jgi:predicted transcriptional regulator